MGFTALPGNIQSSDDRAVPLGEGSNFIGWTSEPAANGRDLTLKIVQLTQTAYASLKSFAPGTNATAEVPVPTRFVRDK